ncbi:hypothetical protein U9M48_042516 [Paspalum notatum var. saurae]|uniref:Uncharacterized protein n=1 Tax=Paspalum notatum var. saurae TaxID=547442 RepID=A0AAQ3UUZ1_PASNO
MRYTDGARDNPGVMAHPTDLDAWKALDEFDLEFAKDARNIRFGLATDGFTPFSESGKEDEEEEAGDGQEDEEAGAGQEDARADEDLMGGDGSDEVVQRRGTRKSHYINPPPRPYRQKTDQINWQWEDVTWDGTGHRRTLNGVLEVFPCGSLTGCDENIQGYILQPSASETYLTAEEYEQTGHPVFADQPGPYNALCEMWASKGFQDRSKKHRNVGTKNASHTLGGDGYRRIAQRTEEYRKEMERRHGEGFDWRHAPVDAQAMYDSGGGKTHGRNSMFNGMIDSRQVQRGTSSQSSGGSSSHQRRTMSDMEMESLRQEIQRRDAFLKAQEEYQRQQQARQEYVIAQQMAAIQSMFQQ